MRRAVLGYVDETTETESFLLCIPDNIVRSTMAVITQHVVKSYNLSQNVKDIATQIIASRHKNHRSLIFPFDQLDRFVCCVHN